MAKSIIAILGLGDTGASLGLALQRANAAVELVGHDIAPEVASAARKIGAVQRTEFNLFASIKGASLIVLAMPLDQADETLALIHEDVAPETLVLVLSEVMTAANGMLEKHLPGHPRGVAGHPIINGIAGAAGPRGDLFDRVIFCIGAGVQTSPDALELASSLVETVGAQPLFVDPLEHDGVMAGVEQLPELLGAALLHMLAAAPGWQEARRMAGRPFADATARQRSADHLFFALRANRANLLPRLAQFERELAAWKQWLTAEPDTNAPHPLQLALDGVAEERARWDAQAASQDWDPTPSLPKTEESPGMMRQLFLGGFLSGKRPDSSTKP